MTEEKMVLHWISQYGVILLEQAICLLQHKPRATAMKIIRGLQKQHLISYIHGGLYIGASPLSKPDPKIIDAIWILLQFVENINPMDHHPASYPSQIYFLKENSGYEILVLNEGEQKLPTLIDPMEDMKYIIVVPTPDMIPVTAVPDAPVIFATVEYKGAEHPQVLFFTEEK